MEKMGDLERRNLLNELIQGRELTKQLQIHLNAPTSSQESRELLLQRIPVTYENALSILKNCGTSAAAELQPTGAVRMVESPTSPRREDSDRDNKDSEAKDTPKKRKTLPTLPRWTQLVPVTPGAALELPPDDGFIWRKYGQKDILGARYPRAYYRCTHWNVQGCLATKQVQRSDQDPTIFEITYCGRHTCNQASSSSQIPPSSSSPKKQDQDTHLVSPQQLNHQLSQNELLLNFQKGLRVITENLDVPQPQPYASFPFPSTSNIETENALFSSSTMGNNVGKEIDIESNITEVGDTKDITQEKLTVDERPKGLETLSEYMKSNITKFWDETGRRLKMGITSENLTLDEWHRELESLSEELVRVADDFKKNVCRKQHIELKELESVAKELAGIVNSSIVLLHVCEKEDFDLEIATKHVKEEKGAAYNLPPNLPPNVEEIVREHVKEEKSAYNLPLNLLPHVQEMATKYVKQERPSYNLPHNLLPNAEEIARKHVKEEKSAYNLPPNLLPNVQEMATMHVKEEKTAYENFKRMESVSEEHGMLADIETEDDELPFSVERYTNMSSKQRGELLTEIPKGDEWIAPKICTTVCKPVLPESPNCPFLVALSLEGSKALMAIPSSFFKNMPVLTRLNLSHTSIRSLPVSLFKLVSLKELSLRHCKLFMELSPQVGQLHNLVLLDLDETQIAELPNEIGKLSNLKILRLSLNGYMNCGKQLQQNVLIHPQTIKSLSQLIELKIDVNPDNDDWSAVEEVVVEEASSLERLKCLILYLPNVRILGKRRTGSTSLSYYPLCSFRFIVGQHKQRIISRVPKKVEAHFQEWDKCLKFVKGNDISSEMKRVVGYTKAFYLERHAFARSLCDFGIKNLKNLEYCLLAECNEIRTIIDNGKHYEQQQIDIVEDAVINHESRGKAFSAQEHVLLNLQYLHIYYLKNLVSIWRNPTCDKPCLSGLKVLELHVCPKLEVIFSPALLNNLGKLEVLIVEDCPELTTVVSSTSNASFKSAPNCFLPSLKMMLLLFLPKLESISSEFHIAPKLEKIGFYDCPELKALTKREMSSQNLKVIKGEKEWWGALEWDESEWESQPNYLHSIFSPVDEDDDVMTQMEEMYHSMKQQNKNAIQ